jgi:hypothetical protein
MDGGVFQQSAFSIRRTLCNPHQACGASSLQTLEYQLSGAELSQQYNVII